MLLTELLAELAAGPELLTEETERLAELTDEVGMLIMLSVLVEKDFVDDQSPAASPALTL